MTPQQEQLLAELEEKNTHGGYWNISREGGQFLHDLILNNKPKTIVEVGASNGYSTIWLCLAAQEVGARVITFEYDPKKVGEWTHNLHRAQLMKYVQIIPDDANKRLADLERPIDFVFLDARKMDYLPQLKTLEPKLSPHAIVAADNVTSHAEEVKGYLEYVRAKYSSTFINIGAGMEVSELKK